MKTDGNVEKLD